MIVSKRNSPTCKLHTGDIKLKVLKFSNLAFIVTDDGKCDTEIQGCMGIVKDTFQKVSKVLRH